MIGRIGVVYLGIAADRADNDFYKSHVILTAYNNDVARIKIVVLDMLPERCNSFLNIDKVDHLEGANEIPSIFLDLLEPNMWAPHELKSKVGTLVMLLCYSRFQDGLCNGTRLIVYINNAQMIEVEIL